MKTGLKVFFITAAIAFGVAVPDNNGCVYAQETRDAITVRTREIRKGRTITVLNDAIHVILTTEKTPGETIGLSVKALAGYEEGVWIDLNNNRQKDAGEEVTRFGNERVKYAVDAQTITLYGKIAELDCSQNNLTAFATSGFSFLEKLNCSSNRLAALDVSRCNLLKELTCDNNRLVLLKTGKMKALERLNCSGNRLTLLDVKKTNTLEWISCSCNNIRGKQTATLFKSLPNRNGRVQGEIIIGESNGEEQSDCTDEQKNIAIKKNWEVINSIVICK